MTTANTRHIDRVIAAIDSTDGAGVKLKRSIGFKAGDRVDPFLMLDAFSTDNPDDYMAGFPPHPHRGFETVTYMLDGEMIHRDHMGNEGTLRSGSVQWMTAGHGVIHEERPQRVDGLMRGFQLWVNLPAKEKMKPAAYQNIEPEQIPCLELKDQTRLKLIAGDIDIEGHKITGPASGISVNPLFIDLELQAGVTFNLPIDKSLNALLYPFEGHATVDGQTLGEHNAVVLSDGEQLTITAGNEGARLLILAGKAIGEPIVQHGPFVMNTQAEINQAIEDYKNNRLTQ